MRDISGVGTDELDLQVLERGRPFLSVLMEVTGQQALS